MDRSKIVQYFSKNPIFLQMEYAFKNKKEVTFRINSKMKMAIIIDNMASKGCYLDFDRENLDYALSIYKRQSLQEDTLIQDRKSTRLNSSHVSISYAVFCLKKKKNKQYHKNREIQYTHHE